MPYRIVEFQTTPNPNALKCILDTPLPEPIRSFRTAESAAGDAVAEALFAVPGVQGVLLSGGWLTINKAPDASWPGVKKGAQAALARV